MTSNAVNGRILGLDVGDRRIGVAISDPDRSFALPLRSVERDRKNGSDVRSLAEISRQDEVSEIVVGLPLSLSGEEGQQATVTREFAEELERRLALPVRFWDERLSTQEAMRRVSSDDGKHGRRDKGRSQQADTDAIAASIILQAYLDSLRFAPLPDMPRE